MFVPGFIMALLLAADFAAKQWVEHTLELGESIPVLGKYLQITLVHNRGAAFNSFEGMKVFLILFPLAIVAGILIYLFRTKDSGDKLTRLSLVLIATGGLGNLIDRIRLGYVVDMIDIRILPVFNVADMCVVCGCLLLLLSVLLAERRARD